MEKDLRTNGEKISYVVRKMTSSNEVEAGGKILAVVNGHGNVFEENSILCVNCLKTFFVSFRIFHKKVKISLS